MRFSKQKATLEITYCCFAAGGCLTCLCLWVLFADGPDAAGLPAALPETDGWPPVAGAFCAIASEIPATSSVVMIVRLFRVVIILALAKKIAELNKKLGPEFGALVDIVKHVDLNSPDGQEIASIIASLGESCGD